MEFSLMGLATVLSPIRSCRELLNEGEHTLFADNSQDWVDQINQLIQHPKQRIAMARRAQCHALKQLGSHQAADLWAPLLQLEQPLPQQRLLLIVDHDNPSAINGEARLANDLAHALRQQPKRRVDWESRINPTSVERWRQHWPQTPPDLLHITGTCEHAQVAIDMAIKQQIPYLLHLYDSRWLESSQRRRLQQAAACTATSARLREATIAAGQNKVTLVQWPWQAFPTAKSRPNNGPVRALVQRHQSHESGLLALKTAVALLPENAMELTVLDDSPTSMQIDDQRWGNCSVHWRSKINRAELAELMNTHQLWIEPSLSGGDDPALAKEVLSAGLWMLASDASASAELLADGLQGALLKSQHCSNWADQLEHTIQQRPQPDPLLHFPSTQPQLAKVLETMHCHIGVWANEPKPVP